MSPRATGLLAVIALALGLFVYINEIEGDVERQAAAESWESYAVSLGMLGQVLAALGRQEEALQTLSTARARLVSLGSQSLGMLDEIIDGLAPLLRAHGDHAMDAVNIKISKFGGLTRARLARDLCVSLGIAVTIEDSWGGDITTAAIAHLAHSTPPEWLLTTTDFNSYGTRHVADGAPQRRDGRMSASVEPGLGVTPLAEALGEPVFRSR